MDLARRILEGICEVELEITPEFQKDDDRDDVTVTVKPGPSGMVIWDFGNDDTLTGTVKKEEGRVDIDATMSGVLTSDTMWGRVRQVFSWLKNNLPSTFKIMVYNVASDEKEHASRLMQDGLISGWSADPDEEKPEAETVPGEPRVSAYDREKGGYFWDFTPGGSVAGRLTPGNLKIDAASSSLLLSYTPWEQIEQAFRWFKKNLPPATHVEVMNVISDEVDTMERLILKDLIDDFNMFAKE